MCGLGFSERTLEEHIRLINEYPIEKVLIISDNIDFIQECPGIKELTVYPAYGSPKPFDYTGLYKMPNLQAVCCMTANDESRDLLATIDYSKISGLEAVALVGDGHVGYRDIPTLKRIWMSGNKKLTITSFSDVSRSPVLEEATLIECGIKNLEGLDKCPQLAHLSLWYNRALRDISGIAAAAESLREFDMEGCPRVHDFDALKYLKHLKALYLSVSGGNTLANLDFMRNMKELRLIDLQMKVADGDLTNCLNVPYADCRNFRHNNLKDKNLPKHVEAYHEYKEGRGAE